MDVSQMMEKEVPLYKVHCYGDYLYRVTKRLCKPGTCRTVKPEDYKQNAAKLDNALARSRTVVRELALCNRWEYFITLTIDGSKRDRYDLKAFTKEFMQWMQNLRKEKYPNLRYLLVPEKHKREDWCGQAWHLHGLISGIDAAPQLPGTPRKIVQECPLCWPDYSMRYGFSTLSPVQDPIAVGFYVSKYITKTCAQMAAMKGVHTYYHSRGLGRSLEVGSLYHNSYVLDKCLKNKNEFYATGFFKCHDVGDVVSICDEVNAMYQSWVISDPVDGSVVGILGGDDEDVWVQEMLAEFKACGMSAALCDFGSD